MQVISSSMISELKLADLHTFGKLTLQSIGELLNIQGYEDMTSAILVEEIEFLAGLVDGVQTVGQLVLPY